MPKEKRELKFAVTVKGKTVRLGRLGADLLKKLKDENAELVLKLNSEKTKRMLIAATLEDTQAALRELIESNAKLSEQLADCQVSLADKIYDNSQIGKETGTGSEVGEESKTDEG